MRKWVRQQFTSYVNCCLYLSVLLGLRGLNKQTERLQRADRNVLEHKVAVGRQRQSFDYRLGFFNRCGVHKEDHATGLILAEPELVDLAVEIEPQSVGDFLRQDPLPLLVRERLGKQTQSKNLHDCSPCFQFHCCHFDLASPLCFFHALPDASAARMASATMSAWTSKGSLWIVSPLAVARVATCWSNSLGNSTKPMSANVIGRPTSVAKCNTCSRTERG